MHIRISMTLVALSFLSVCVSASPKQRSRKRTGSRSTHVSAAAKSEAPAGIILQVEGTPQVIRSGKSMPASRGHLLVEGDIVRSPARSKATIVFADAREEVVAAGKSYVVRKQDLSSDKESIERWRKIVDLLRPAFTKPRYGAAGAPGVRGQDDPVPPLDIIQPREFVDEDGARKTGRVIATTPIFVFTPLPNAKTYRLRIESLGETVVDRTLTDKEVLLDSETTAILIARPEMPPLPTGTLRWQIIAGNSEANRTRLAAFRSTDPSKDRNVATLLSNLPPDDRPTSLMLRGASYESEDFYADAIACYQKAIMSAPEEPMFRRQLARLYDRIESFVLADREIGIAARKSEVKADSSAR